MKKLFVMMFLVLFILSACNSSKLSFSEIENVPNKVQDEINADLRLQSMNEKNGTYIIFHSNGEVEADLETRSNTAVISFSVSNTDDVAIKQNVYYLKTDSNHEAIDVQVNGESIPFDEVIL